MGGGGEAFCFPHSFVNHFEKRGKRGTIKRFSLLQKKEAKKSKRTKTKQHTTTLLVWWWWWWWGGFGACVGMVCEYTLHSWVDTDRTPISTETARLSSPPPSSQHPAPSSPHCTFSSLSPPIALSKVLTSTRRHAAEKHAGKSRGIKYSGGFATRERGSAGVDGVGWGRGGGGVAVALAIRGYVCTPNSSCWGLNMEREVQKVLSSVLAR